MEKLEYEMGGWEWPVRHWPRIFHRTGCRAELGLLATGKAILFENLDAWMRSRLASACVNFIRDRGGVSPSRCSLFS